MKPGFTVGETARICSIPADTLRYYDKIGLIRPMEKRRNERHRIWKKILRSAWQAAGLMTCCSATLWRSWTGKLLEHGPVHQRQSQRRHLGRTI